MFPLLVLISYAADRGWLSGNVAMALRTGIHPALLSKDELAAVITEIRKEFGDIDEAALLTLVERRTQARPSKAVCRQDRKKLKYVKQRESKRNSTCGMRLSESEYVAEISQTPTLTDSQMDDLETPPHGWRDANRTVSEMNRINDDLDMIMAESVPRDQATIEFSNSNYAVRESAKQIVVTVVRGDYKSNVVSCSYRTIEGKAKAGSDFVQCEGTIKFGVGETAHKISVDIIDDEEWEDAEDFYIQLFDAKCDSGTVVFGPNTKATVTIIDDDDPGVLKFGKELIVHDANLDQVCSVEVFRTCGCKGQISCTYRTEDNTAVAPLDYEALTDRLVMNDGQLKSQIDIKVVPRGRYESMEEFRLILSNPTNCRFDKNTDGDEDENVCTIQLKAHHITRTVVDKLACTLALNLDKTRLGYGNWKQQFLGAFYVGGLHQSSADAGKRDWIAHFVTLPWKVVCATIPPPDFGGGWCCFVVALIYVGITTAGIGDFAMLFGCALDIPDQVTAITFVALGTSLPDTFASKIAAREDPYADASITNITGSNSVNVFLGLGFPWTVSAIFWSYKAQEPDWIHAAPDHVLATYKDSAVFVVKSESLGFTVTIFTICAICAIFCLWLRRSLFGGELGGPWFPKLISSIYLGLLWMVYIAASWIYLEINKS
jgi:solute carrier family 8 (sodium/calcium exchanger)